MISALPAGIKLPHIPITLPRFEMSVCKLSNTGADRFMRRKPKPSNDRPNIKMNKSGFNTGTTHPRTLMDNPKSIANLGPYFEIIIPPISPVIIIRTEKMPPINPAVDKEI